MDQDDIHECYVYDLDDFVGNQTVDSTVRFPTRLVHSFPSDDLHKSSNRLLIIIVSVFALFKWDLKFDFYFNCKSKRNGYFSNR